MWKFVRKVTSLAFIPVQLYFGYLAYKNFVAPKQNPSVQTQTIKEEVNVSTEMGQNEPQENTTENATEINPGDLPEDHPKIVKDQPKILDLTPEATVNGLSIGQTTPDQVIKILGNPLSVHQNNVYIYENINLYFQDNALNGFTFPGMNGRLLENSNHSPFKTSSGLTLGTPLQKVFEKYGPRKVLGSGKITYRDTSNNYVLNISYKNDLIASIEVIRN